MPHDNRQFLPYVLVAIDNISFCDIFSGKYKQQQLQESLYPNLLG